MCRNYWNRGAPKCEWKPVRGGKIAKVAPKIVSREITTFYVLSLDTAILIIEACRGAVVLHYSFAKGNLSLLYRIFISVR